ncbi:MAG: phosphoenolpyruvate--protein phosphotransferase [Candidatus Aminicenantes bacterium]|nr:phosphoenolpyruvate--protein phosphotransferase [Candidatus Aminicenantes bacterium]
MEYFRLRGIGVSPGIAVGEVHLSEGVVFTSRKNDIKPEHVDRELKRLDEAILKTEHQLKKIKAEIGKKVGTDHSFIFEAHLFILQDENLVSRIKTIMQEEKTNAERAISKVFDEYSEMFRSIEDEYFKQREYDLKDVLSKIYLNLESDKKLERDDGKEKILVAHDLLPSEAALKLSQGNILAVALDIGGTTSHTAILARSLNIPAVMGLSQITRKVKDGDTLIVDGTNGDVIINPPLAIKREFESKQKKYDKYIRELKKTARLESQTLDQVKFFPLANIELPDEVSLAFSMGAEGIGLFRTEFIFFQTKKLPCEEDHYEIYSQVAKSAGKKPVYIRTVDIGGEKNLPQMNVEKEPNPALGLRGLRLSLKERGHFKTQLRAILRASAIHKNVHIMLPMVTGVEEIEETKLIIEEVKEELTVQKHKYDKNIPLGIMIEVPAAAAISDNLVKEVDYVSIGTNDLIQYYLAVDRSNEDVSYLFKPLHPSVLRLLKFIIESAKKEKKDVTVCGEMAADPLSALALLGLGLTSFSMNPIFIPKIKKALRSVEYKTIKKIVEHGLNLKTAREVEEHFLEKVLSKHPKALLVAEEY